ncbi:MAG: binding domain protein [Rhodospirillales bacterium]|nr:binding domain protein [Rhodospirillales bacterium]
MYRIADLVKELDTIECTTDPVKIRVKSRDHYAVSPLLKQMLAGKTADVVASPKTKDELLQLVRAAVKFGIPITERGGGTANYGQSVPLRGGILLDMSGYSGIVSLRPGMVRAKAGTIMATIDEEARKIGWELRFYPTTKKLATIAGHVAGGQGGPGSVVYGTLRDRGNVAAAQVVTMEAEPRILELRGRDAQLIHHTYGATGIITEIEMPLAPAWDWIEAIVAFPEFMQAVRFGVGLANAAGIIKKLASIQEWPTPQLIRQFAPLVPEGHSIISTMIARESWEEFQQFVAEFGGTIASSSPEGAGPYGAPITEFAFGHALFQIQKHQPNRAALEGFFRGTDLIALIERVHQQVKSFGPMRMELIRIGGEIVGTGSPYFLYESPEQMAELVRLMQTAGAGVSNSHTSNVRAVGKKEVTERDLAFKRDVDPYGLLNPGRFEADSRADERFTLELPTDSWDRRLA